MTLSTPTRGVPVATLLVVALLGAGCAEQQTAPPPPPPEVTVTTPEVRDVEDFAQFTGRTEAVESVEIRARVPGELKSIHYRSTEIVNPNQLLFTIEQEPYIAAVETAKANIELWNSEVDRFNADLVRLEQAIETNAVSAQEVDSKRADVRGAEAQLAAAEAALIQAELDLSYTEVRSPIRGLVSRRFVDVGNLVGQGEATLLATVVNLDPIYVYFDVPERGFLEMLAEYDVELGERSTNAAPAFLGTVTEEGWPHQGTLDSFNNTVDSSTGTIEIRGVFPNTQNRLFPGLFARIRVPMGEIEGAVLVREDAIGTDLGGKYVLVVADDNVVDLRHITLGALQDDNMRVVLDGVEPGERYIINGLQRARPGLPVSPTTGS